MTNLIFSLLLLLSSSVNTISHQNLYLINKALIFDNGLTLLPPQKNRALSGNWTLESGKYKNETIIPDANTPIKITFFKEHITGFAALNNYFAIYEEKPEINPDKKLSDKKKLKIAQEIYISKEVGDKKLMDLSSNYLRALQNINSYYFENRLLVLAGDEVELKFKKSR